MESGLPVAVLLIGSEDDLQPFLALALALKQLGAADDNVGRVVDEQKQQSGAQASHKP